MAAPTAFNELKAGARRVFKDHEADKQAECNQRIADTRLPICDADCHLDDQGLVVFKTSSKAKKARIKKA
jgi:hypothetical protein